MSILTGNTKVLYSDPHCKDSQFRHQLNHQRYLPPNASLWSINPNQKKTLRSFAAFVKQEAFWEDASKVPTVQMEPILDSEELDVALAKAQELSIPIVIEWMASWCRKCIYLKPKLEKLAIEYDSKTKFYCVDVNKVPQSLVKRGNISKMPTIQVWKEGEMKGEIIGGHKAWLVVEEVREMVKKYI